MKVFTERPEQGQSLTSVLPMAPVWRNDHLPLLAHTHASQTFLQTRDHLVRPQGRDGGGVVVVPGHGHMTCYHSEKKALYVHA